jgi:hypothetical protein
LFYLLVGQKQEAARRGVPTAGAVYEQALQVEGVALGYALFGEWIRLAPSGGLLFQTVFHLFPQATSARRHWLRTDSRRLGGSLLVETLAQATIMRFVLAAAAAQASARRKVLGYC